MRSTRAIRDRARFLLARARAGESRWFTVNDDRIEDAARLVGHSMDERYPGGAIPFHSRWRHFEAGGIDRRVQLDARLPTRSAAARAHAYIDLAVVSVLLDAGAGPGWHYTEPATGLALSRSEGLGVASYHAFTAGLFSGDADDPFRVDGRGLRALTADALAEAFQVSASNPLVGLEGRVTLLRRLGEALERQPEWFGPLARPGGLFDTLVSPLGPEAPRTATLGAHDILSGLLDSLSGIWPQTAALGGVPLGDCWRHDAVPGDGASAGWMPFHKLSQWLTYSLLEPFAWGGVQVGGLEALTGLPEYRNGGLLIDSGVLRLKDEGCCARTWHPGDELIVEWRALTVALLDALADEVRSARRMDAASLPLACVLEGGTWAAGRALAQDLRGGLPPLAIDSDGTVF